MTTETSAAADPSASLDERLAARRADLSPAEQRVADFFAQHQEDVVFFSAMEIAQRIGTSDASVVRTAQSLGYSGLQELKREFVRVLRSRTGLPLPISASDAVDDRPGAALDHVLATQIELLEEMRRTVRTEDFERALDILHAADRILVFGTGPSASLADHLVLRLIRLGRQGATLRGSGIELASMLLQVRPGDALVAMAYRRAYPEVRVTLRHAKERGVPIVLLTDTLGMALAEQVTVTLSARRGKYGIVGSGATTLVILDAFVIGLAARDRARAVMAGVELTGLNNELNGKAGGSRIG